MDSVTVILAAIILILVVLLMHYIALNNRLYMQLVAGAERREQETANQVAATRRQATEQVVSTLGLVNEAVAQQIGVIQESVKVAWAPTVTPQTQLTDQQQKIMEKLAQKYQLPVIDPDGDHDFQWDPTDQYLSPDYDQANSRQEAVMLPADNSVDSVENPTGIPGFKAAWT